MDFPSNITTSTSASLVTRMTSTAGFIHLPPTIIDAFVPGYSILADFFLQFGIDISFYVSLFALALISTTAIWYAVNPVIEFVLHLVSSSIYIDEYDQIFEQVLSWVAAQPSFKSLRAVRGYSQGFYYDSDDDDEEDDDNDDIDHNTMAIRESMSDDTIFNFKNWAARAPPKYEPHTQTNFFYHKGYVFRITRASERISNNWSGAVRERERLVLTVLWRSTKPIRKLIEEARELALTKQTHRTVIRRPAPREQRGERHAWRKVTARPSRSLATVVLDDIQKDAIVRDINDFLHPRTVRWYSNRGIPYRRGYLLHGPPGTGKTSLSFALAGVFGLDIYCLSLSEVTLTEEDLILLFNTLPKRCLVLLEDIDSAGVSRPKPPSKKSSRRKTATKKKKDKAAESSDTVTKTVEALAKVADASIKNSEAAAPGEILINAITISGLLNAIDGVASQEGRILIMTTNFPEKLDDALVRPGRVDLKIEFTLASKQQMKELFTRMYCVDNNDAIQMPTKLSHILPISLPSGGTNQTDGMTKSRSKELSSNKPILDTLRELRLRKGNAESPLNDISATSTPKFNKEDIELLAEEFAALLPDLTFSPAEVQGYLMMRKQSPLKAVIDAPQWRDDELARMKIVPEKKIDADGKLTGMKAQTDDHQETKSKEESGADPPKVKEDDQTAPGSNEQKTKKEEGSSSSSENEDERSTDSTDGGNTSDSDSESGGSDSE